MKTIHKRISSLVLAAVMSAALIVPAAAQTAFSDVPSNAWYAQDVADVQKYGIINGIGSDRFAPDGLLSYAQAITMAARAFAYTRGETKELEAFVKENSDGMPWYMPYMGYAMETGYFDSELPISQTHIDSACPRETMANLFYCIVAGQDNVILNDIQSIPDVSVGPDGKGIYDLYRFGILTGSDKYGTFYPDRSITRAEAAAILNRLLNVDKRQSFKLEPKAALTAQEAISLVIPVAVKEQELYGAVVMRDTGEVVDVNDDAYVIQIGVADFIDENGEWGGGGFWAVYWVDRRTSEVRFVTGLQDYYVPGMVDMETGEYLGYPHEYW